MQLGHNWKGVVSIGLLSRAASTLMRVALPGSGPIRRPGGLMIVLGWASQRTGRSTRKLPSRHGSPVALPDCRLECLQPCRASLAQIGHQGRVGAGQVPGLAQVVAQVVELVADQLPVALAGRAFASSRPRTDRGAACRRPRAGTGADRRRRRLPTARRPRRAGRWRTGRARSPARNRCRSTGTSPGQARTNGTRMPPSQNVPLPPRNGRLRQAPQPLSPRNTIAVRSAIPAAWSSPGSGPHLRRARPGRPRPAGDLGSAM